MLAAAGDAEGRQQRRAGGRGLGDAGGGCDSFRLEAPGAAVSADENGTAVLSSDRVN